MAKDLTSRDILQKPIRVPTRASQYSGGRWSFIALQNPIRVTPSQSFYRMNHTFGIVSSSQNNPKICMHRGKPGEYIAEDKEGALNLVTVAEFDRIFPTPNAKPPTPPVTSESLSDPTKLTETFQKTKPVVSYKKKKLTGIQGLNKPNY